MCSFVVSFFEEYLPSFLVFSFFLVFMLSIICRYFYKPISWSLEISLAHYLWISLFGALFAQRKKRHIMFTVVYDACSERVKCWMRIAGNGLLCFTFIALIPASYKYIHFMRIKGTDNLRIPMPYIYWPFILFLVFMSCHLGIELLRDIRKLCRKGK